LPVKFWATAYRAVTEHNIDWDGWRGKETGTGDGWRWITKGTGAAGDGCKGCGYGRGWD